MLCGKIRLAGTSEYGGTSCAFLFFPYGLHKWQQPFFYQPFRDIVLRAEFHAFHCRMYLGVVGHDDEALPFALIAHPLQQSGTFTVGQAKVGKYDVLTFHLVRQLAGG